MYRIGELAKLSGLSTHTLRFYEKEDLINASERTEAGYRLYTPSDVDKARFINHSRKAGFSLQEIRSLLDIRLDKAGHTCEEVTVITRAKLAEVNARIDELARVRDGLEALLDICCGGPEPADHCSILSLLEERDETESETGRKKPNGRKSS